MRRGVQKNLLELPINMMAASCELDLVGCWKRAEMNSRGKNVGVERRREEINSEKRTGDQSESIRGEEEGCKKK